MHDELVALLQELNGAGKNKETCDLPGCENPHNRQSTFRLCGPHYLDLHFCCLEHKVTAIKRWGLEDPTLATANA